MLLDCIATLGKQLAPADRAEIEDAFYQYRSQGFNDDEAGLHALSAFHKTLFDDMNRLRAQVNLAPVALLKAVEFDGLTLGRAPTALEQTINLKGMVEDFENGKGQVTRVLLALRSELIEASADVIAKIKPEDVHKLILAPPDKAYARVKKVVDICFLMGQKQVVFDLAYQQITVGKSYVGDFLTKKPGDKWQAFLNRIVDRTISRIINEIQTRAINFFVARGLLDRDDTEIIAELRAALEDQSTKTFESMAQETSNSAIGAGRDAEIEARSDEWEIVEYSCVLDSNSCDPCSDADGMQGTASSDLPDAPNPDCLGNAKCRCFHVAIYKERPA